MELLDEINFQINGKLRKIELYLGDITKLKLIDKVDLLLVSSFPSNYSPIPGTLIGALLNSLSVSVKDLAKDKSEDLRKDFHCWISKPLSDKVPYKRILCFEQGKKQNDFGYLENPAALVGAVFRALFTAFSDDEWSLITPILATGNQGSDKKTMIRAMIKGCSSWIIAGMPLKSMKIVIYRAKETSFVGKYDQEAIDEFSKLKSEMNWKPVFNQVIAIKYDLLILFTKQDEDLIEPFMKCFTDLISEDNRTIIFQCLDEMEKELDDQKKFNFQQKMIETKKVVVFLTPTFLTLSQAVELYNLALCLTHKTRRNLLTPIYLKNISQLPEYMSLNQWIDCRIKNSEDLLEIKFVNASQSLWSILKECDDWKIKNKTQSENESDSNTLVNSFDQSLYEKFDIFISYCHKDSKIANIILSFLRISLPNIKIFFDVSGIKSGYSWQETIYLGINNSTIILALLSENYIQSTMCREELSLATSQHQSPKFSSHLIPIWISNTELKIEQSVNNIWKTFSFVQNILIPKFPNPESTDLNLKYISFCQELLQLYILPILSNEVTRKESSILPVINLEDAALQARISFFKSTWSMKTFNTHPNQVKGVLCQYPRLPFEIVIAFHEDDLLFAQILQNFLLIINKGLKIKFSSVDPKGNDYNSFSYFDQANLIIILLNPYYISTKACINQLEIALSLLRRQSEVGFRVCPLILESLPSQPSYIHLLPSRFKSDDEIYQEILNKHRDKINKIFYCNSEGSIKNKVVTAKAQVMLYFVASWIGESLFSGRYFIAPKTPVIFSTYDLINTNFNDPVFDSSLDINDQIEFVLISSESLKLGKRFIVTHDMVFKNVDSVSNSSTSHQLPGKSNEMSVVNVVKTKACLLM